MEQHDLWNEAEADADSDTDTDMEDSEEEESDTNSSIRTVALALLRLRGVDATDIITRTLLFHPSSSAIDHMSNEYDERLHNHLPHGTVLKLKFYSVVKDNESFGKIPLERRSIWSNFDEIWLVIPMEVRRVSSNCPMVARCHSIQY